MRCVRIRDDTVLQSHWRSKLSEIFCKRTLYTQIRTWTAWVQEIKIGFEMHIFKVFLCCLVELEVWKIESQIDIHVEMLPFILKEPYNRKIKVNGPWILWEFSLHSGTSLSAKSPLRPPYSSLRSFVLKKHRHNGTQLFMKSDVQFWNLKSN